MSDQPLTNQCPYCSTTMVPTRMSCPACRISVEAPPDTAFPPQRLASLPTEHQRFIEMFVLASGNLKQIAEVTGVSYPTVRSRLDKVIDALRAESGKTQRVRGTPLDAVGEKKLSPEEAGRLIKEI